MFFLFLHENVGTHKKRLTEALLMSTITMILWRHKGNTPQPLYNTIVGVHSINRVS